MRGEDGDPSPPALFLAAGDPHTDACVLLMPPVVACSHPVVVGPERAGGGNVSSPFMPLMQSPELHSQPCWGPSPCFDCRHPNMHPVPWIQASRFFFRFRIRIQIPTPVRSCPPVSQPPRADGFKEFRCDRARSLGESWRLGGLWLSVRRASSGFQGAARPGHKAPPTQNKQGGRTHTPVSASSSGARDGREHGRRV